MVGGFQDTKAIIGKGSLLMMAFLKIIMIPTMDHSYEFVNEANMCRPSPQSASTDMPNRVNGIGVIEWYVLVH